MHSNKKKKGKTSLGKYLPRFMKGDKVVLKASPSEHGGKYCPRFHGLTGNVVRVMGRNCEVKIKDMSKSKFVIANSVHLVKVKNGSKNS